MRFIGWNVLLATWLLLSAFFFGQTPATTALTFVAAILVAFFALAAGGRPGLRFVITLVAAILAIAAIFTTGASGAARMSNALVAALLFALSVVRPTHERASPSRA